MSDPSQSLLPGISAVYVSVDGPSAIDHQGVTYDHVGKRAGEEEYSADQVIRLIPASARNHLLRCPLPISRAFEDVFPRLGLGDTGSDGVHQNSFAGPLQRERFGHV